MSRPFSGSVVGVLDDEAVLARVGVVGREVVALPVEHEVLGPVGRRASVDVEPSVGRRLVVLLRRRRLAVVVAARRRAATRQHDARRARSGASRLHRLGRRRAWPPAGRRPRSRWAARSSTRSRAADPGVGRARARHHVGGARQVLVELAQQTSLRVVVAFGQKTPKASAPSCCGLAARPQPGLGSPRPSARSVDAPRVEGDLELAARGRRPAVARRGRTANGHGAPTQACAGASAPARSSASTAVGWWSTRSRSGSPRPASSEKAVTPLVRLALVEAGLADAGDRDDVVAHRRPRRRRPRRSSPGARAPRRSAGRGPQREVGAADEHDAVGLDRRARRSPAASACCQRISPVAASMAWRYGSPPTAVPPTTMPSLDRGRADEPAGREVAAPAGDARLGHLPPPHLLAGVAVDRVVDAVLVAEADERAAVRRPRTGSVRRRSRSRRCSGRAAGTTTAARRCRGRAAKSASVYGAPAVGRARAVGRAGEHQAALDVDRRRAPHVAAPGRVDRPRSRNVHRSLARRGVEREHAGRLARVAVVHVPAEDHQCRRRPPATTRSRSGPGRRRRAELVAPEQPRRRRPAARRASCRRRRRRVRSPSTSATAARRHDLARVDVVVDLGVVGPAGPAVARRERVEAARPVADVDRVVDDRRGRGHHVGGVEEPAPLEVADGRGLRSVRHGYEKVRSGPWPHIGQSQRSIAPCVAPGSAGRGPRRSRRARPSCRRPRRPPRCTGALHHALAPTDPLRRCRT